MRDKTTVRSDGLGPWVRQLLPPLTGLEVVPSAVRLRASVVVLAKDEERCLARCLDSVVTGGFDDVVVVDTGSGDGTLDIVAAYADRGVRLVQAPWAGSFAEVRNLALDAVGSGWVVFLDADEWVDEESSGKVRDCLDALCGIEDLSRLVFAPRVFDVDRGVFEDTIPRIFLANGDIRFKGAVHEYPVVRGAVDEPVGVVCLNVVFRHDGYRREVVEAKDKRRRNMALLKSAVESDPGNPRWLYFMIRDGLPVLGREQVFSLCDSLRDLSGAGTGDLLGAAQYRRLALAFACQGLAAIGDWDAVHRFRDELDLVDAHYLRTLPELLHGVVTRRDLLRTMEIRNDDELVSRSAVDPSGAHVDALIGALLGRLRGEEDADRYRALCSPWTDAFFERSVLRGAAG